MLRDFLEQLAFLINTGIQIDARAKNQKIPQNFRLEVTNNSIKIIGPDYFKYLVHGRGPGKQPPPERMLKWVQQNPTIYAQFKAAYKNASEKSLAFLVGRKIARYGTDIFQGKKQGIAMNNIVHDSIQEVFKQLPNTLGKDILQRLKTSAI